MWERYMESLYLHALQKVPSFIVGIVCACCACCRPKAVRQCYERKGSQPESNLESGCHLGDLGFRVQGSGFRVSGLGLNPVIRGSPCGLKTGGCGLEGRQGQNGGRLLTETAYFRESETCVPKGAEVGRRWHSFGNQLTPLAPSLRQSASQALRERSATSLCFAHRLHAYSLDLHADMPTLRLHSTHLSKVGNHQRWQWMHKNRTVLQGTMCSACP